MSFVDALQALVWDRGLTNPMNLVVKHTDLREQGVTRMLSLDQGQLPPDMPETIVFICRARVELMKLVALMIRSEERERRRKKFHLFFLPRSSGLCTKWLEVGKGKGGEGGFIIAHVCYFIALGSRDTLESTECRRLAHLPLSFGQGCDIFRTREYL